MAYWLVARDDGMPGFRYEPMEGELLPRREVGGKGECELRRRDMAAAIEMIRAGDLNGAIAQLSW